MRRFFYFCQLFFRLWQPRHINQRSGISGQFKMKIWVQCECSFTGLQGNIQFDPAHPDQCHFDVTIDAASVNMIIRCATNICEKTITLM